MFSKELCLILIFYLVNFTECYNVRPGPAVIATKGQIWPKPRLQDFSENFFIVDYKNLNFNIVEKTCPLLDQAIDRYKKLIGNFFPNKNGALFDTFENGEINYVNTIGNITSVNVVLTKICQDEWPKLGMDESYTLVVGKDGPMIQSDSIWGIMRGLESFSQLLYMLSEKIVAINKTTIVDSPRFSHRGLLLDTSRHFIPMEKILQTLDAMEYNKLNVFHWHIVDDQSFPYQSKAFPEMSLKGSYHPKMIYTPDDVQKVIQYARNRGIRVMVEFDTPGHTRSWGEGVPKLLTTCYSNGKPNGFYGPIDPSRNSVYDFLHKFFKEVVTVFPEYYIHLGGDEVDFDCWKSNLKITNFMKENGIKTYAALEQYYIQKLVDIVTELKAGSVVWQEVFVNGVKLPNDTVVHVWIGGTDMKVLNDITKSGLPALYSACWYLDHIEWGGDWQKYYKCEPFSFNGTVEQESLVMGGEACMWAESVDSANVISRVWPRASAAAERLWSEKDVTNIGNAEERLEEHTCRMRQRGIAAQPPNGPGFCYFDM